VGLARFLRRKGIEVVEVNRPNRQARRNHGKSDPLDAVEAARAALSGSGLWGRQVQRRSGRGHPGLGGSQTLGPWSAHQGDRPDAPPRYQRP
jgi:hypothetical protein